MFEADEQLRVFGVTSVENLFFAEYLPGAEGDFVKVYLMCLYHAQLRDDAYGPKEMASELSMDESRVEAALRYWERRRVLTRVQSDPPRYRLHHLGQRLLTGQDGLHGDRAFELFSEAVYALFGDRRKIRPSEIAASYEWVEELGLPQHVVLLLLSHCMAVRGIGFTFKSAEKLAVELKEAGIQTEEDAERYLNQNKEIRVGAQKVLRRFGLRRSPTDDEMRLYKTWIEAYGFSHEDIQDACAETVKASNPTFAYLDGVLSRLAGRSQRLPVRRQLDDEQSELALIKETLDALGLRISPIAVRAAYQHLLSQYTHGEILLAAGAVQRKRGRFEDLPVCLAAWRKKGLTDEEKIRAFLDRRDRLLPLARTVLDNAGQEGAPTDADIALVEKWLAAGSSPELIACAALQARSARQKAPYIDKVLDAWRAKGVTTAAEAEKLGTEAEPARTVIAQRYAQRDYTEDDLARGANALIEEVRSKREP